MTTTTMTMMMMMPMMVDDDDDNNNNNKIILIVMQDATMICNWLFFVSAQEYELNEFIRRCSNETWKAGHVFECKFGTVRECLGVCRRNNCNYADFTKP